MPALKDDIRLYLESILGADVTIKPASALKVPHYIKESYQLANLVVSLGDASRASHLSMILLLPVNDQYPGVVTLGKHLVQVRKVTDEVIVYACRSLSVSERRSLIASQINFIQPGYQLFIPELAMDLRERIRARRNEQAVSALFPAAQAMLLARLYEGWDREKPFSSHAIMEGFKYSRVTLGKVIDQLTTLEIIHATENPGFKKLYSFTATPAAVYAKARPCLRSPVKRKVAIDRLLQPGNGVFLSGESALATLTMLADPAQPVFGMSKNQFDRMRGEQAFKVAESLDMTKAWIEIWAYSSLKEDQHIADEASLLLSLQDNPDERVQQALDELRENVTWLKSED